MKLGKLFGKAKGLVEDNKDKLDDVAQVIDDKAEGLAAKDGKLGDVAEAVHKVADKVDKD